MNSLTGKLNGKNQTSMANGNPKNAKISILKKYNIRNRFTPLQNTEDKMLDLEVKN